MLSKTKICNELVVTFAKLESPEGQAKLDEYFEDVLRVQIPDPPRHPTRIRSFQMKCLAAGLLRASGEPFVEVKNRAGEPRVGGPAFMGWFASLQRSKNLEAWLEADALKTVDSVAENPDFVARMLVSLGRAAGELALLPEGQR